MGSSSQTVGVFGSTGSIGTQSLEVLANDNESAPFHVEVLTAGNNLEDFVPQIRRWKPRYVAFGNQDREAELREHLPDGVELVSGPEALGELASLCDVSINGVVGFAGLPVTLACLQAGKRLALANKESLIAAGPVVQQARLTPGAELIPVDSEHAALHQCLLANQRPERVTELLLTASGGPFRGKSAEELAAVSVSDALNHPTWSMGPKITVDSSTLMNKGLEVIEAHELFGNPAGDAGVGIGFDEIEVVVHPQSIVHSMVTYSDGSTIAQLSNPDMRLPIGYALAYPDRFHTPYGRIDWRQHARLDFEPPDRSSFPCLDLAYQVGRVGGTAPAWLSGANEVAVEAFLDGQIGWGDIPEVIGAALESYDGQAATSLDDVLAADRQARRVAQQQISRCRDE